MEFIQDYILAHSMEVSALLLICAYILIASEKIHKVTVALLGACLTVILGILSQSKYKNCELNPLYFVNYIDFNVIFLLISMMIIVSVTTKSGVFSYLAQRMLAHTGGNPKLILVALSLFTGVLSAFLDNVTTVILVMPITFAISDRLNIDPTPLLIAEIFSSNIGGTATLIGDPPNIIIGSAAGFSFMDFVYELTPVILVILLAAIGMIVFLFRKELKASADRVAVIDADTNSVPALDRRVLWRSLTVLVFVIAGFIFKDFIGLDASIVALFGASVLLLFEKPDLIWREVEWNTIFFFMGLFIIIGGLEASGGIKLMAQWVLDATQGSQSAAAMLILWTSGFISGVIDNIPYTATMAPMIGEIRNAMGAGYAYPLWWCLSLGACLGGNMTIIGAAANVIVSENAARNGHPISFMRFFGYGFLVMILSLSISAVYVWFRFLA